MKKKIPNPIYIEWLDHCTYLGKTWYSPDELDNNPIIVRTVGWVLHEDKKSITLAASSDWGSNIHGLIQTVLKNCIIKRKVLK